MALVKSKQNKRTGSKLTWEVAMDGMSDACGPLQGDIVQKHVSLFEASPLCSSGCERST